MEWLKQFIKNRREKKRLKRDVELKSFFKVKERGGRLWLTHDGVAFMEIAPMSLAEDVAKELDKARKTAVEYDKL